MSRRDKTDEKPIEQYDHKDKQRVNNPPVGLVTPETDKDSGKKSYAFDPHLDPQLQWAGKAEHTSFEVPTVSLHVHERIDPLTIIEAVRKREKAPQFQLSFFESPGENPPIREAIEFYKHKHNWSNRLIAGDSLLVMNSLLEKEGMGGKVQMIYIDPPYGIKYGSNFQPFINKRDVKDGKDEDLTQEPEMIKAFRDTWELEIHSYLTYLRDRLLLARELLTESGSIFVQISDENVHHVREIMDELFGTKNFCSIITFVKTTGLKSKGLPARCDFILWYARDINRIKYHQLFRQKVIGETGATQYDWIHKKNGEKRKLNPSEEIEEGDRLFHIGDASAMSSSAEDAMPLYFDGKEIYPPKGRLWQSNMDGMKNLQKRVVLF